MTRLASGDWPATGSRFKDGGHLPRDISVAAGVSVRMALTEEGGFT